MQSKPILLAFILVSVVATEPIMAALNSNAGVERKSKVEKVKSAIQTFKNDILSIFSRKGCTRKQKIRLGRQGGSLLGATAVLASIYYGHSWRKGSNEPEDPAGEQELTKEDPQGRTSPAKTQKPPEPKPVKAVEPYRGDATQQAQPLVEPPQPLEEARSHLESLREKQQQADDRFEEKCGWKLERADKLEPTWENRRRAGRLREDYYQMRNEHESSSSYLDLYNQIVAAVQAVRALEGELSSE